ncbi:MAG: Ig-like domain-containing protein [Bacteroidia bacterium]|nr:Ig-like domain-containing protein [Bacteroidia bacterium]MDW8159295.1 Ig-like domain-containing protein [Bacteroidia bacterium]
MSKIFYLSLRLVALVIVVSCASIKEPSGGLKDQEGPRLVSTSLPNGSTHFKEKSLAFTFNEFLNPDNLEQAIFFSPPIEPPPEIFTTGRVLHIKFKHKLKPNTTYVITLGRDIKDFNEKNPIAQPYQYAFSTGEILDTLAIRGSIKDAYSYQGAKNFLVLLFNKDTLQKKGIFQTRPQYVAQIDDSSAFNIAYVKAGVYRILAIEDKDRSFTYNLPTEKVAQPLDDTLVSVHDSTPPIFLLAFMPDANPPKVKKIQWLNTKNIIITFTEPITKASLVKSDGSELILNEHYKEEKNTLLCPILSTHNDSIFLHLRYISDTAGNKSDTLLQQKIPSKIDNTFQIYELPFNYNMPLSRFFQSTAFIHPQSKAFISIKDSAGKAFNFNIELQNYTVSVHATEKADTSLLYKVVFAKGFATNLALPLDTTISFNWKIPSTENLGSIKGNVISSVDTPLLIFLETLEKKKLIQRGPFFHFKYLPPGNYRIGIIEDEDQNLLWTPGSILPYKKTETLYYHPEFISLPPGWEVENYELIYPPLKK